jgi:hypothetical protein
LPRASKSHNNSRPSDGQYLAQHPSSNALAWVLLFLTMVLVAAVRIRLLGMPLERDEGEYAYAGQLILHHIAPYELTYSMKFPGIYYAYALQMSIFGQTAAGVHMGLLLANLGATALVFLLGKRLFGPVSAVVACMSYALASTSLSVLGFAGHATHYVVLFALAGLLMLLRASETKSSWLLFLSGLLLGLGVTMKQPGLFFVLFALAYACRQNRDMRANMRHISLITAGAAIPISLVFLSAWATGTLNRFWFWAFKYGFTYAGNSGIANNMAGAGYGVALTIGPNWPTYMLAALGICAVLSDRAFSHRATFALGLLAASACAVSVGFYFRNHYFVMMLPAISLLAGCAVESGFGLGRWIKRKHVARLASGLVFLVAFTYSLGSQYDSLALTPIRYLVPQCYSANPFAEAPVVADYIRRHSAEGDTIAVVGSEPEICFYSNRRSATGYIYTYPLTEKQPYAESMRREMIHEIESANPEYIVIVASSGSWCGTPADLGAILRPIFDYTAPRYNLTGYVAMLGPAKACYYWENAVPKRIDQSVASLTILRKRK